MHAPVSSVDREAVLELHVIVGELAGYRIPTSRSDRIMPDAAARADRVRVTICPHHVALSVVGEVARPRVRTAICVRRPRRAWRSWCCDLGSAPRDSPTGCRYLVTGLSCTPGSAGSSTATIDRRGHTRGERRLGVGDRRLSRRGDPPGGVPMSSAVAITALRAAPVLKSSSAGCSRSAAAGESRRRQTRTVLLRGPDGARVHCRPSAMAAGRSALVPSKPSSRLGQVGSSPLDGEAEHPQPCLRCGAKRDESAAHMRRVIVRHEHRLHTELSL
jgi:hypothetical protein